MAEAELVVGDLAHELLADERLQAARRPAPAAGPRACSTALRWKRCPSTAARSSTCRSSRPSRSRRDASSTWIEAGTGSSLQVRSAACQRPSSIRASPPRAAARRAPRGRAGSRPPRGGCAAGPPRRAPLPSRFLTSRSVSAVGERLEEDRRRVVLAAAPRGPHVVELRPRHADEQDRRVPRPLGDVLDEVEERRLAPVDVVEDDARAAARGRATRAAAGPPRSSPRRSPVGPSRPVERGDVLGDDGRPRLPRRAAPRRRRGCRRRRRPARRSPRPAGT